MSAPGYKYLLSLPERTIRSLAAISGGLLRELGEVALPAAVRRTTLYRAMVEVTLRFLIEQVGQVAGVYAPEGGANDTAGDFVVRRTASHAIELLGIFAFRASPVWVIAALADVTAGGHTLVREIAEALEKEGLLEPGERFDTAEQILGGLERTSSRLALNLNLPPARAEDLRREWDALREELKSIPPDRLPGLAPLESLWTELRETAAREDRTVFTVSSLVALSALAHLPRNLLWLGRAATTAARRTGEVAGSALLDHYSEVLKDIGRTGFLPWWKREFGPYLRAAVEQFTPGRESTTERLLRRATPASEAPCPPAPEAPSPGPQD
jgi:hypothetical protein